MRLVVRSLVLLTFPVIAFGWLATARILPDQDDWAPAFSVDAAASPILFLLTSAGLVVGGGIYLMLTDFFGSSSTASTPRPLTLAVVVLVALAAVAVLSLWGRYLDGGWGVVVILVAGTIAVGFVALLGAVTLVRAVIGLWSRPELPIWPGRRAVTLLFLLAAIAATPIDVSRPSDVFWHDYSVIVPLVEKLRMDLVGDPTSPAWRY